MADKRWRAVIVCINPKGVHTGDFGQKWRLFYSAIQESSDAEVVDGSTGALMKSPDTYRAEIVLHAPDDRQAAAAAAIRLMESAINAAALDPDCGQMFGVYEWPEPLPLH